MDIDVNESEPSRFDADSLPACLRRRLKLPLPGRRAQVMFEPEAAFGLHFGPPSTDTRAAAVAILMYRRGHAWHVPLTIRRPELASHGGQISLPGGMLEQDESSDQAAIRELEEEIGVAAGGVEMLGRLSPINLFSSRFYVVPWLAVVGETPRFVLNESEVAGLIELPLAALMDRTLCGRHRCEVRGTLQSVPHLAYDRHQIWGATAMILGELRMLCDDAFAAGKETEQETESSESS